jgi:aryl-alcohol dehydrogenase-like predicted oxidoreductase
MSLSTRSLAPEGLTVSALGLGCWGMSPVYGPTDDSESLATLERALDPGVTLLDTSMSYGSGHNQRLLAGVLATRRDEVILATKFGIVRDAKGPRVDGRPENVRGYCEASLPRLGVEHVDLYCLHRVDPEVPVEETIGAMAELVAEGKVRHLGICEVSAEALERAAATHPITAVQSEWWLWWRDIEDGVVPTARRLGIGLFPYSPLDRGFLTAAVATEALTADDLRRHDPRFQSEHAGRNHALVGELNASPAHAASRPPSSCSSGCSRRATTSSRSPAPSGSTASGRTSSPQTRRFRPPT